MSSTVSHRSGCRSLSVWLLPSALVFGYLLFLARDRGEREVPQAASGTLTSERHSGISLAPVDALQIERRLTYDSLQTPLAEGVAEASKNPLRDHSGSVEVLVIDALTGGASIGVPVFLSGTNRPWPLEETTDWFGRVQFHDVQGGQKVVSGQRSGSVRFRLKIGESKKLELKLEGGFIVDLEVVTPDGLCVPNASVFLSMQSNATVGVPIERTDPSGRCTILGIEPGRLLWVHAGGFESSYAVPILRSGKVSIRLMHRGFDVTGRIIDARSRAGIPDATIWIQGYATPGTMTNQSGLTLVMPPPPPPRTLTDETGSFKLGASSYAGLLLLAQAPGYARYSSPLGSETWSNQPHELVLEPSEGLYGRVVDDAGEPLPDARLSLSDGIGTVPIEVQGGEDGYFWIPGAPPGLLTLEVDAQGGYFGRFSVPFDPQSTDDVLIRLNAPESILIRVLTEFGQPVPSCVVVRVCKPTTSPAFQRLTYLGQTGSEGTCRIPRHLLGSRENFGIGIGSLDPTFPYETVPWSAGMDSLTIRVPGAPSPGSIRIRCVGWANGERSGTPGVFVKQIGGGGWVGRIPDDAGDCNFEGLGPGTYRVLGQVESRMLDLGTIPLGLSEERLIELRKGQVADYPEGVLD